MKNKKLGFTLIELLAVIVVLAIIALIATPLTLNSIESSKRSAFKDSVIFAAKGANIEITSNGTNVISEEGINVTDLNLEGDLNGGKFIEKDDKAFAYYVTNDSYCAYGPLDDLKIAKDCASLDDTAPVMDYLNLFLSSTTKNIKVTITEFTSLDQESGIKNYTLKLYDHSGDLLETINTTKTGVYSFQENLKNNTQFEVELIAENGNGLSSSIKNIFKRKIFLLQLLV